MQSWSLVANDPYDDAEPASAEVDDSFAHRVAGTCVFSATAKEVAQPNVANLFNEVQGGEVRWGGRKLHISNVRANALVHAPRCGARCVSIRRPRRRSTG